MALMKLCRCSKRIPLGDKYCIECTEKVEQLNKERHKINKLNRTDKNEQELYTSQEWIKTSDEAKRKTFGLDVYELYINNRAISGQTVHHIVEVKDDWDKRLDISNLIYLTNSNHKHIHNIYLKGKEEKKEMQNILLTLLDRFNKEFKSMSDLKDMGGIKKF